MSRAAFVRCVRTIAWIRCNARSRYGSWSEAASTIAQPSARTVSEGSGAFGERRRAAIGGGEFEVGRPPGLKPGTPLDFPVAVNSTPLPLEPGRYEWRLTIDAGSREDWTLPFTVRGEEQA